MSDLPKDVVKLNEDGKAVCKKCGQLTAATRVEASSKVLYMCEVCEEAVSNRMRSQMKDRFEGMNKQEILKEMLENGILDI
jgi:superfamily II helicase